MEFVNDLLLTNPLKLPSEQYCSGTYFE